MIALLHRQHSEAQSGAAVDLDGDGVIEVWEREYHLTPIYLDAMQAELQRMGVGVVMVEGRPYGEWHTWACAEAAANPRWPVAYCAAHLNSVPGGSPLAWMFYDRRSSGGQALAQDITDVMAEAGERTRAPTGAYDDRTDSSTPWLYNPWYTIRGIYQGPSNISSVCLEPDTVQHLATLGDEADVHQRLDRVGRLLGQGVYRWLQARR